MSSEETPPGGFDQREVLLRESTRGGAQGGRGRWAAIGRIVLFTLLTVFFLLAGLALVIQPALRWGGLVLVTLALVCASFGLLGVVELRGKRPNSGGGPRVARWVLGIASVVFGWLATARALAFGRFAASTVELRIVGCQADEPGIMPDQDHLNPAGAQVLQSGGALASVVRAYRGVRPDRYHLVTGPDGRCLAR